MEKLEKLFSENKRKNAEDFERIQELRLEKEELQTKLRLCNKEYDKLSRRYEIRTAENKLIARNDLF
jgi:hypothetical protein